MSQAIFFFLKSVTMALSQIWANKARSFLTALGIIVGVASVTAVIAALTGLKAKVLTEFESVGAARLYVFPNRPDNAPRTKFPWEKCRLKVEEARAIVPIVSVQNRLNPFFREAIEAIVDELEPQPGRLCERRRLGRCLRPTQQLPQRERVGVAEDIGQASVSNVERLVRALRGHAESL